MPYFIRALVFTSKYLLKIRQATIASKKSDWECAFILWTEVKKLFCQANKQLPKKAEIPYRKACLRHAQTTYRKRRPRLRRSRPSSAPCAQPACSHRCASPRTHSIRPAKLAYRHRPLATSRKAVPRSYLAIQRRPSSRPQHFTKY